MLIKILHVCVNASETKNTITNQENTKTGIVKIRTQIIDYKKYNVIKLTFCRNVVEISHSL
jgi:hypothetical protein